MRDLELGQGDPAAGLRPAYIREHGALRSGAPSPTSVVAAINAGCTQAFDNDAEQDVTVVQAIKG